MRDQIEISPTEEPDIAGLVDLFWTVAAEERWIGTGLPFDRVVRADRLRATITDPDALSLVARADGK